MSDAKIKDAVMKRKFIFSKDRKKVQEVLVKNKLTTSRKDLKILIKKRLKNGASKTSTRSSKCTCN